MKNCKRYQSCFKIKNINTKKYIYNKKCKNTKKLKIKNVKKYKKHEKCKV